MNGDDMVRFLAAVGLGLMAAVAMEVRVAEYRRRARPCPECARRALDEEAEALEASRPVGLG